MRALEQGMTLRQYRLQERLGQGGGGEVWRATTPSGRTVAVKAQPRTGSKMERQLRKEFERLRPLRIPRVVRVLDVGTDQGWVFYAMELAEGVPFDRYIAANTLRERVERTVRASLGIAQALAGVHGLGLSYRDLKPSNVIVDEAGQPTLIDFGTVRFDSETDPGVGTLAYMAPEQRAGQREDHRADLYSFGSMLHEAISGTPAGVHPVGRPRPSLALRGPEVPLQLAHLVDRLCSLDASARPSALECEALLEALAAGPEGPRLPPAPAPSPWKYAGDAKALLTRNALVVGPPGSGCTRMVSEARWHWYAQGYLSVAGRSVPTRPHGPIREIVSELLPRIDRQKRDSMPANARSVLRSFEPNVAMDMSPTLSPPLRDREVTDAFVELLRCYGRVALVFWSIDRADPGTRAVLRRLQQRVSSQIRIWGTAQSDVQGFDIVHPPDWTQPAQDLALEGMLPRSAGPLPLQETPLHACLEAWRVVGTAQGRDMGPGEVPVGLAALSVLEEPFPISVAYHVSDQISPWIEAGLLEHVGDHLRFASRAAHRLASRHAHAKHHKAAARAWGAQSLLPDRAFHVAHHLVSAEAPTRQALDDAIRRALDTGNPTALDRWLGVRDLWFEEEASFVVRYARLYATMSLRPREVDVEDLKGLTLDAQTDEERGLAAHLALIWRGPDSDLTVIAERGRKWASQLAEAYPAIASKLAREAGLAALESDDLEGTLADCNRALLYARDAAVRSEEPTATEGLAEDEEDTLPHLADTPITADEVAASITYSAALLYSGRVHEAIKFCATQRERTADTEFQRGRSALLANEALGLLSAGDRATASRRLSESQRVEGAKYNPVIRANTGLIRARLAVERGDLAATRRLLDIAATAAQSTRHSGLLCEVWTLALEAAVQTANQSDASRAMVGYGHAAQSSTRDHWPAVLGRWHWLTGDLDAALEATNAFRLGHSGRAVAAERCRLLLVSGHHTEARNEARGLLQATRAEGMAELSLFAQLVVGVVTQAPDREYAPLMAQAKKADWVHLYLGSLHLDALRRQFRGENVGSIARQLRTRAKNVGHRLYEALGREEAW